MSETSIHLLVAVTHHSSARLLKGQLAYFRGKGYRVTLLASPGAEAQELAAAEGARLVEVDMQREISLASDVRALLKIYRFMGEDKPDLVNAGTPKAGLLVLLAAALRRVRCRIYTLRGLRLETAQGIQRIVLWVAEWLACRLAHRVICISPSLKERAIHLALLSARKAAVIRNGSSNGIEVQAYELDRSVKQSAASLRTRLGIVGSSVVIGFVGRLSRSKGLPELLAACELLIAEGVSLQLLLVGARENTREAVGENILMRIEKAPHIHWVGEVSSPIVYYAAMDIFVLPTHREGFGNVLIEAAAAGLPVVATRVPGCIDAVADGETGILVPPRNPEALARALKYYISDAELRSTHGANGKARVTALFERRQVWEGMEQFYRQILLDKAPGS
jgi:glycosyltransferase involved in cell wall biosynthesis